MASARQIARIERLTWVLIYGGLIVLILGIAVGRTESALGWTLGVLGTLVAIAGFVLIPVRARMREDSEP